MIGPIDTFPRILIQNAHKFGDGHTAIREKEYGIWQPYSWKEYLEQVKDFAFGLASLGFRRDERLAIIGDNRPPLYWGLAAAQCLGGIPVPLYQDAIEDELYYILNHCEATFALAEDQEQCDKLLALKKRMLDIKYIIYDDPRGMRNYHEPFLLSFTEVQKLGVEFSKEHPTYFSDEVNKGQLDDLAIIDYTSGTTGYPKGVMLNYCAVAEAARGFAELECLTEDEEVMAYLPLAWIGDHIFSYAQAIITGFTCNCPEDPSTVLQDMREIGPTYIFCPPRIWENLLTMVMIKMDDAAWIKQKMFHFFLNVAYRVERRRMRRESVPLGLRCLYQLGRFLVYAPLLDNLGMGKVRVAYTAGEAIGPEIFEFFRSLGINLKQIYGMTESSAFVCVQRDGDVDSETVGPACQGVDIKISETGEVLYRSPGNFCGYLKDPEATSRTLEAGWIHSGDAGYLTRHGHLKIIDRIKDVSRLRDGTLFAPKYIENKLKFSPFIKEAIAHGKDGRYVSVFIDIDYESVGNWAEKRHIAYTSYVDLARRQEVYDLIHNEILRVNKSLSQDKELRGAQIKRFLLLHKELDPDDGEITRTRKVRRSIIEEKYQSLLDALYSGKEYVDVDATFTYENGRTTTLKANLRIQDVESY
jgi:long-chain acyl-CoA synthetase